jgi:branched-chain amino acid transport system permease protein
MRSPAAATAWSASGRPRGWRLKPAYYLLVLACTVAGGGLLVRMLHAPFGLALRASRDSPIRAAAIGLAVPRLQWAAFVVAGTIAGLAGSLFAFAKGTISPETLGVAKSVDGLVMVLLGGVQAISGPWVGGALFTWLQDTVARQTDYWRALLGIVMLALVLVFPLGVAGGLKKLFIRERRRRDEHGAPAAVRGLQGVRRDSRGRRELRPGRRRCWP